MIFSIVAVMLIICVFILAGNGAKKEAVSKEIRVGLFLYRGDDTFISTLRSCIEEIAKEYERTGRNQSNAGYFGCKKQPEYSDKSGRSFAGT